MKNNIFTRSSRTPGFAGAIVRLCLVVAILLGGFALTVLCLPSFATSFTDLLTAAATGILCSLSLAVIVWAFVKWAIFAFPYSCKLAKRFWNLVLPLSLLALLVKIMVWIYLLMLPVVLFGLIFSPLSFLVYSLSMMGSEVLAILIFAVLVVGSLALMVSLDVCKIFGLSLKKIFRSVFGRGRKISAFAQ